MNELVFITKIWQIEVESQTYENRTHNNYLLIGNDEIKRIKVFNEHDT